VTTSHRYLRGLDHKTTILIIHHLRDTNAMDDINLLKHWSGEYINFEVCFKRCRHSSL